MEHGLQGLAKRSETQEKIEERQILPALSLHFDHQQLQSSLHRLLGRCLVKAKQN